MRTSQITILDQGKSLGGCDVPVTALDTTLAALRQSSLRVGLVNMPFSSTRRPSIQLGLLQAIVERYGVEAQSHYLNLSFANRIGWELTEQLCQRSCSHLLGEWLFAGEAFEDAPKTSAYIAAFEPELRELCAGMGCELSLLTDLRERQVPEFLDACISDVSWGDYDVVGLTSVFQQNCPALALARRIRQVAPHVKLVFGGCNFEGEMGLEFVRAVSYVDYAVIGEGDVAFPALLDRIAAGDQEFSLPNIAYARDGKVVYGGRAPRVKLDDSPTPNYDDFFDAADACQLPVTVGGKFLFMPFESARGCWWGAKHHCTFCSMNKVQMEYHSKSPERTLADMDTLVARYGVYALGATDNILDQRYIKQVFGPLSRDRKDYAIHYDVKANLTADQLRDLARGGVCMMQPGIESLNSHVLDLMDKGATGIVNVRLLKWARYYGIAMSWHVLHGFPGETTEDYAQQLEFMRLIPHLQPPNTTSFPIRLEKFSPNYTRASELGFENLRPGAPYPLIYPSRVALDKVALFFDHDAPNALPPEAFETTDAFIRDWIKRWNGPDPPYLVYRRRAGTILIQDGRRPDESCEHEFRGEAALVYESCSRTFLSEAMVGKHLQREHGQILDPERVRAHLDHFCELGLMMHEGTRYLSLALPLNRNW